MPFRIWRSSCFCVGVTVYTQRHPLQAARRETWYTNMDFQEGLRNGSLGRRLLFLLAKSEEDPVPVCQMRVSREAEEWFSSHTWDGMRPKEANFLSKTWKLIGLAGASHCRGLQHTKMVRWEALTLANEESHVLPWPWTGRGLDTKYGSGGPHLPCLLPFSYHASDVWCLQSRQKSIIINVLV